MPDLKVGSKRSYQCWLSKLPSGLVPEGRTSHPLGNQLLNAEEQPCIAWIIVWWGLFHEWMWYSRAVRCQCPLETQGERLWRRVLPPVQLSGSGSCIWALWFHVFLRQMMVIEYAVFFFFFFLTAYVKHKKRVTSKTGMEFCGLTPQKVV